MPLVGSLAWEPDFDQVPAVLVDFANRIATLYRLEAVTEKSKWGDSTREARL